MRLANRAGRVIALARLLLALFFLLASARAIDGQVEYPRAAQLINAGYIAWAVLLLALTWRNWWLDYRLGLATHLIDLSVFVALDLAAGVPVTSPFFIFFTFLVLSSAARWGWRVGMWTAAAATILFIGETFVEAFSAALGPDEYLYAVLRGAHLLVLSLMLSWFGMTHLSGTFGRNCAFREIEPGEDPIKRALTYFAGCLRGRWSAMVWTEPDEPWIHLAYWDEGGDLVRERAGPEDYEWLIAPELNGHTFLFDMTRQRTLSRFKRRFRRLEGRPPINPALAARVPHKTGIATPIETRPFAGYIFVGGMDGLAWEEVASARRCATDLARGFERWETTRATAETTESEARLRIARNLHDSVAQIMAGIGLKLRAARTTAPDAAQRDLELKAIEEELVMYQRQIHGFIEDLRRPQGDGGRVDLEAQLTEIAVGLRRQWAIRIDVTGDHLVSLPKVVADEVTHLFREAAANAVRHGGATHLFLSAEIVDDCLRLTIQDNGKGFPEKGSFNQFTLSQQSLAPRSILERVSGFGGTVDLVSGETGVIVSIVVPLGTLPS